MVLPSTASWIGHQPESVAGLLQRLSRPDLPRRRDGELMGPQIVWLKLLSVVEIWIRTHLPRSSKALAMLRESIIAAQVSQHGRDAESS